MADINYAKSYQQALTDAFPYVLNFGALYSTPNNGRYRWTGAKTIEIPSVTTTGRVNANRDTVAFAQRNYDNSWEEKTLTNQRKWSTLVHPMDIDQTNYTTTIANITTHFNSFQKFPEMDAYTVSKIYADWTAQSFTADTTELTVNNVLSVFDALMLKMDNKRVPANGRILYCTHEVKTMLKNAGNIEREWKVQSPDDMINRTVNRLDEVQVIGVPAELMKTLYNFTSGWVVSDSAAQINMFLVHPVSVITPISYTFATLDAPSGMSEGKWVYYEESFEDVFILNKMADAIQFNITPAEASV